MSCATPTSPAPQPWNGQVLVSGRIIDYFTDAGVAGAHVAIGGTTPSTAVTDASGFYSLSVPAGEQSVVAVDGQTIAIVVQMDFPTFRGGYYVNGTGCAARYGMVVDKTTRRPVSGAAIRVSPGPIAASTDGGGWYNSVTNVLRASRVARRSRSSHIRTTSMRRSRSAEGSAASVASTSRCHLDSRPNTSHLGLNSSTQLSGRARRLLLICREVFRNRPGHGR